MEEGTKTRMTIEQNASGVPGMLTLNEDVVTTIAGLAAREVDGIASVGKSRIIGFGKNPKRGVHTELGQKQAAFDIDLIIEYGKDIRNVARHLREKIATEVNKMAGREVVEINLHVVGIQLSEEQEKQTRRVL